MKYLFIIDFPYKDGDEEAFERYQQIESQLEGAGSGVYEVDGDEWGSGTFDIFLYTNDPQETLRIVRGCIQQTEWRGAYKHIGAATFRPIFPPDLKAFELPGGDGNAS